MKWVAGDQCELIGRRSAEHLGIARLDNLRAGDFVEILLACALQADRVAAHEFTETAKKCITMTGENSIAFVARQGGVHQMAGTGQKRFARCALNDGDIEMDLGYYEPGQSRADLMRRSCNSDLTNLRLCLQLVRKTLLLHVDPGILCGNVKDQKQSCQRENAGQNTKENLPGRTRSVGITGCAADRNV